MGVCSPVTGPGGGVSAFGIVGVGVCWIGCDAIFCAAVGPGIGWDNDALFCGLGADCNGDCGTPKAWGPGDTGGAEGAVGIVEFDDVKEASGEGGFEPLVKSGAGCDPGKSLFEPGCGWGGIFYNFRFTSRKNYT